MRKEKTKEDGTIAKLMGYAGPHAKLTAFSLVLAAVSAVLALMPFVYLWRIIKEVIAVRPDFASATQIVHNGWMAVLFALLTMVVYFAALICSHLAAFRVAGNMKKTMLRHIAALPVGFADAIGSGKVRRIVTDATAATENLLAHNLPDMASAVATPIAMILLLFLYDWRFGLVCLIPVILSFLAMGRMAGPGLAEDIRGYQSALENMSNEAVEYIRGVPVVKTFGQTVFSFHRFKKSIDDYKDFCMRYTVSCRGPMVAFTVLINSAFTFIVALTLFLTGGGGATEAILLNFLFYAIFTPVITTTMNRVMFLSEGLMIVNDVVSGVEKLMGMAPLPTATAQAMPHGSEVVIKDATFRYGDGAKAAVDHLDLTAKEKEVIALVGPSGGGKTTVAGLIARFFDVESGSVSIGGVDVRNIPKEVLNDTVAYVFQDSKLLCRSIADNLRLARPDATDAELAAALHQAECDDIIARLPDGVETVLGASGTYLSGGEQQRIAIARAILKGAPVVILDEATAFIDPENEALVQKAFTNLAKSATVIMIAHRLSTVVGADQVYVLDDGRVVEKGTHRELLAAGGLYKAMWDEYQTAVSWKVGATA